MSSSDRVDPHKQINLIRACAALSKDPGKDSHHVLLLLIHSLYMEGGEDAIGVRAFMTLREQREMLYNHIFWKALKASWHRSGPGQNLVTKKMVRWAVTETRKRLSAHAGIQEVQP